MVNISGKLKLDLETHQTKPSLTIPSICNTISTAFKVSLEQKNSDKTKAEKKLISS